MQALSNSFKQGLLLDLLYSDDIMLMAQSEKKGKYLQILLSECFDVWQEDIGSEGET